MIRAMVWKEYREHRAIWLALAIVGGAGLFGLSQLMAPNGALATNGAAESLQAVAILLAWTYGLVCGSMLLANERECATLTFLDMLPARRLELWLVKSFFGLLLFLAQLAVLTGFVLVLDISASNAQAVGTILLMFFFGLLGMSWGLLFSARGESVLNVIGLAILGQIGGAIVAGILFLPFAVGASVLFRGTPLPLYAVVALAGLTLLAAPVFVSMRIFTLPDRLRGCERELAPGASSSRLAARPSLWAGWGRMLWLSYSQMRRLIWGLSFFSLALGFALPATGPAMWGALTLFIGVLCGVSICADEQLHGSFRFLGDQRFPLGRVWFIKVGMRFALAVFAAFLLLLPSLVLAVVHRVGQTERELFVSDLLHSSLVGPVAPATIHLTMWLLYGFTMGQLGGLLFRKSLVAAVVSLGGTTLLVSVWIPSLLGIGLHFWQMAVPPLILLGVGWLLVPAWAADRLLARGTFVRLGAAFAAIALWMTFGLWYRVAEIPDVPEPFDVRAFTARIPLLDKNTAGLRIRGAWGSVSTLARMLRSNRSERPLFPDGQPGGNDLLFQVQVKQVSERGWPKGQSDLGKWLDEEFGPLYWERWYKPLAEAADLPLGYVEDVRITNISLQTNRWWDISPLSEILAVRGLQQQARDDPGAFVDNLRIGLAVIRNMQHFAPPDVANWASRAEDIWAPVLDRWLEKLQGHPELLKKTLEILTRHEAETPDPEEAARAGYLIALHSLNEVPEELLAMEMPPRPHEDPKLRKAELDAAALMWRIPWEQERHERILRFALYGDHRRPPPVRWGGIALGMDLPNKCNRFRPRSKRELADLRAAQLKVALRLYQAENGKPAATLEVLVPRYLPSIPADPFDGQAFRYRLSRGERLARPDVPRGAPNMAPPFLPPPAGPPMPGAMEPAGAGAPEIPPEMPPGIKFRWNRRNANLPAPGRDVPKGQGILWSVGEDGHDDGGTRECARDAGVNPGEDIIYLVPPPPRSSAQPALGR